MKKLGGAKNSTFDHCRKRKVRPWANLLSEKKNSGLLTTANHLGETENQERKWEGTIVSKMYFVQMWRGRGGSVYRLCQVNV